MTRIRTKREAQPAIGSLAVAISPGCPLPLTIKLTSRLEQSDCVIGVFTQAVCSFVFLILVRTFLPRKAYIQVKLPVAGSLP